MRHKSRKGYILAEVLLGLVILTGVLVAMSQFLADSLLAMARAGDSSGRLMDSYTQARWIAFEDNLDQDFRSDSVLSDLGIPVSIDVSRTRELDLVLRKSGGGGELRFKLGGYDVGEKNTGFRATRLLKLYRLKR